MSHSSFLCNDPSIYAAMPPSGTDNHAGINETPFDDAESAWFWCVRVSDAIHNGARTGNAAQNMHATRIYNNSAWGSASRPCEAVDIQKIVLRLSQENILTERHINVLSLYGKRRLRPAANSKARLYWQQAMNHMTPVLQRKGIVAL